MNYLKSIGFASFFLLLPLLSELSFLFFGKRIVLKEQESEGLVLMIIVLFIIVSEFITMWGIADAGPTGELTWSSSDIGYKYLLLLPVANFFVLLLRQKIESLKLRSIFRVLQLAQIYLVMSVSYFPGMRFTYIPHIVLLFYLLFLIWLTIAINPVFKIWR